MSLFIMLLAQMADGMPEPRILASLAGARNSLTVKFARNWANGAVAQPAGEPEFLANLAMSMWSCTSILWVFNSDLHGDLKDKALETCDAQAAKSEDRMFPNPSWSMLMKASRGAGQPGR